MKFFIFIVSLFTVFGSTAFVTKNSPTPQSECITLNVNGRNLDFTLINRTGYTISNIYVAPTTQREWGEDIMGKDLLNDDEEVEIIFDADENVKKWDMYVTWDGYDSDEDVFWIGFDLSEISEIELFYEASTGKTWAVTK